MTAALFRGAVRRILRPLVRAMIGRGLTYPQLIEVLKELYIDEAARSFNIDGKRMTVSRISVLTGLQRKDVKAHTAAGEKADVPKSLGPIPRVVALWRTDPRFLGPDGEPRQLARSAEGRALLRSAGAGGRPGCAPPHHPRRNGPSRHRRARPGGRPRAPAGGQPAPQQGRRDADHLLRVQPWRPCGGGGGETSSRHRSRAGSSSGRCITTSSPRRRWMPWRRSPGSGRWRCCAS